VDENAATASLGSCFLIDTSGYRLHFIFQFSTCLIESLQALSR